MIPRLAHLLLVVLCILCTPLHAAEPPAASGLMSAEQLEKLVGVSMKMGGDGVVPAPITAALGIGNDALTLRQLVAVDEGDVAHAFMGPLPNGGYVVAVVSDVARLYYLDANLMLVAAILTKGGGDPVAIPFAEADAVVQRELLLWGKFADGAASQL
jgi:hypothetical protein